MRYLKRQSTNTRLIAGRGVVYDQYEQLEEVKEMKLNECIKN